MTTTAITYLYRHTMLLFCFALSLTSLAQTFKVDTLILNGPTDKRINLVYLGDGYTSTEMSKYISDVQNINNLMLNTFPLNQYKNYFNVFAIRVISNQSGVKHSNTASDCPGINSHPVSNPDNFFGTQFDYAGIHRLVVPANSSLINSVLATNFPSYDQALIIANTGYYGGSGGTFATATTNTLAAEIMIHEIGHSFTKLADEYWAGTQYAREMPNMTAQNNPALVKWKNWTSAPNIGIYPHTGDPKWFKPSTNSCKMEALGYSFCSVCSENFIERFHALTQPIESFTPDNQATLPRSGTINFKVKNLVPNPNTLKSNWKLNGTDVNNNIDNIFINTSLLNTGNHTVQYTVSDTNTFSRADNHSLLHTYNIIWNISSATGISQPELIETSVKLYPNPANEMLNVSVKLGQPSKIGLRLLTMDGKEIYRLASQNYPEGNQQINIDLNKARVNEGICVLQLIVNGNVVTKEFIRLR